MQYKQNKGIITRRVDDSVFLVNPEYDALYQLDGTGTVLWLALSEPMTAKEAAELLLIAFPDADHDTVVRDVDVVLKDLADHHLISGAG